MTENQPSADVIDALISDHRDVEALIGEIKTITDPMMRRDLTDTAISELVRHAVAEEMYVYPAMRKHLPNGDRAVEHDIEEHKELERVRAPGGGPPGSAGRRRTSAQDFGGIPSGARPLAPALTACRNPAAPAGPRSQAQAGSRGKASPAVH
jgi:hypothetical protein